MKTVKLISLSLFAAMALSLLAMLSFAASAPVSPALGIIASSLSMTKSGVVGNDLHFCQSDFDTALRNENVASITLLSLPDASRGTLKLGEKPLEVFDKIDRADLSDLCFVPACNAVMSTDFTFGVVGSGSQYEVRCVMWMLDCMNFAPTAQSDCAFLTYRDVVCFGELSSYDPEGDAVTYEILRYPSKGLLVMSDDLSGSFRYIPAQGAVGRDSFSFEAVDCYGNRSEAARVNLTVVKPEREVVYEDMIGSRAYNAAITLAQKDIMTGKTIAGVSYFMPDETISRAEFLASAMQALGIKVDASADCYMFTDSEQISASLRPYVECAYENKYISGSMGENGLVFSPNDPISSAEAAVMLKNILALPDPDASSVASLEGAVPTWALSSVCALNKVGILVGADASPLSRSSAAVAIVSAMKIGK